MGTQKHNNNSSAQIPQGEKIKCSPTYWYSTPDTVGTVNPKLGPSNSSISSGSGCWTWAPNTGRPCSSKNSFPFACPRIPLHGQRKILSIKKPVSSLSGRTYSRSAATCIRRDNRNGRCPHRSHKNPRRIRPVFRRIRRHLKAVRKTRVTTSVHDVRSVCASYITITECTGVVEPVAFVARTHVTPERVGTVAVFAQIIVFLAFVDVFEYYLNEK